MKKRTFQFLMQELCDEMDIKMEKLSNNQILQLTKDDRIRHIYGHHFDINPHAGGKIAENKYDTFEVLKSQNIPVIEHSRFYSPILKPDKIKNGGIWPKIISLFNENGCLVVKADIGSEGRDVFLCKTQKELEIVIHKAFNSKESISICPFYDIDTEYRTFYLNGKVCLIYGKIKPYVIGDGVSNVGTLIKQINMPNRPTAKDNIAKLDLEYVPEKDEKVLVSWKHNLSGGAVPIILDNESELYKRLEEISLKVGKKMNMNFATVDIIHTTKDELYVMEVNSGICTARFIEKVDNGYDIIKEIYREAIEILFQ
ncbi:MAG: hypothetical protein IKF52_04470 [Clostridia bacterium]|nr:hypothetical protein [Clostridia bacterium]